MSELIADVFGSDAFSMKTLTEAINEMPFTPQRASTVVDWNEEGVATTTIIFEKVKNVLRLVMPSARGGPGETRDKVKREMDSMIIPHYELNGGVNADEVQGVRMFGSANQMETAEAAVARAQLIQAQDLDATIEYQRLGAIKGIVSNADGSEYINLFTKFGVTPQTEVDFNLDSTADDGALITTCDNVKRSVARALGMQPFTEIYGFVSDEFWDALMSNTERRKTYQAQAALNLQAGTAWNVYRFGGIAFENYRGGVGDEEGGDDRTGAFIEANKGYFFPVGVPRLFRTVYAPADYWNLPNTLGLARYSRLKLWENDKGVAIDSQTNALSYCTRPRALVKGKLT